ncbi:MAG: DUF1330 domain-containing protein [Candidatus Neomarinimicrobiota bacterium]
MAAYVIADVDVTDPEAYEEYRRLVPPIVAQYGGKYLVRAGRLEKFEGDWTPKRLVVLEFDSLERAKQWYESEEYKPVREIRFKAAISKLLIEEGA